MIFHTCSKAFMDTHIGERDTDEKQRREKKTRSQRWEDHCSI